MNIRLLKKYATYLGILGSVAIPALVIAQSLPSNSAFRPGELVRASDLQLMRDALQIALDKIEALEDRVDSAQPRITKDNGSVYTTGPVEVPLGAGAISSAVTRCEGDDVMLSCSCAGSDNADLRIASGTNEADPSACTCRAQGVTGNARITAGATCLRVQ